MSDDDIYFMQVDSQKSKNKLKIRNTREEKINNYINRKLNYRSMIYNEKIFAMFLGYVKFLNDDAYAVVMNKVYNCKDKILIHERILNILKNKHNETEIIRSFNKL